MHGHRQLRRFARPVFGRIEPQAPRELHAQRGCALVLVPVFQIDVGSLDHARHVKTVVMEESLILHRDHGMHQNLGDVFKTHDRAPLTILAGEIGDELRGHGGIDVRCARKHALAQLRVDQETVPHVGISEKDKWQRGQNDNCYKDIAAD